jgi:hypothetical protein
MAGLGGVSAIAQGVSSHKDRNFFMLVTNVGHSNFAGLDPSTCSFAIKNKVI